MNMVATNLGEVAESHTGLFLGTLLLLLENLLFRLPLRIEKCDITQSTDIEDNVPP